MPLKHLAHYAKLSLRMIICALLPKGCYIKPVCCQCCSMEESVAISSQCVVSAALWRRVLLYQASVLSVLLYGGECCYIKPVCCQCCSMEESVAISSQCVVSAALWRRVLLYQASVLSVLLYGGEYWYIKPVCCQCCSMEESVGISSQCVVSAALWRRVLVYQASVLSVLLYGGECWIPVKKHQKRLNTFHHCCICTILGTTCTQQWEEHISSRMMRSEWRQGDHNN